MLVVGLLEEVRLPQAPHQGKSSPMQAGTNTQGSRPFTRTHVPLRHSKAQQARSLLYAPAITSSLKAEIAIMQAQSGSSATASHVDFTID